MSVGQPGYRHGRRIILSQLGKLPIFHFAVILCGLPYFKINPLIFNSSLTSYVAV